MRSAYIFLLLCCAAVGCRNNEPTTTDANNAAANPANALFTPLNYEESGITFKNRIVEQGKFNIFTYEYLYNGAGVAVGDINNDGLTDIYFSGNMVPNKLFLNKGNLKFEDITETAGVDCNQGYKPR
ncbi:MAG: VCBS repeat-containing protein [Sphingobacteriales bacterium]|nr:VCBS repeat-containing protein [Sphingobacteriales bacterium]